MNKLREALSIAIIIGAIAFATNAEANDLIIDGELVNEPCIFDVDSNTLNLQFGTIIKKGLLKDSRTSPIAFNVTLSGCDLELGKLVNLVLTGQESSNQKGFLATTGTGSKGVDIGLETPEGISLPINVQPNERLPEYDLSEGVTIIPLQAFVSVGPDVIKESSLAVGNFAAVLTLDMSYP